MTAPYKYELAYELKEQKKRFDILLFQFRELGIEHERLKKEIKVLASKKYGKSYNFDFAPF